MVQKIADQEFDKVKKEGVSIIDFSAAWCGPCQMLAPVFEEVSNEFADTASFYKVDVDESRSLSKEFSVTSVPTLVVLKNGEQMETQIGFQPKKNLENLVKKYL
ncbi:MAG: thioredoxin [Roseburia sp.]|nr:thioredoxin [Roseburia sp.]